MNKLIYDYCRNKNFIIICFFPLDWNKEPMSEPPPTKTISNDDLMKIGSGEKKLEDFIPKVFSHR